LIPNEQNIFLEISIEKSLIEKSGQIWWIIVRVSID
jgi:hypothetical protein